MKQISFSILWNEKMSAGETVFTHISDVLFWCLLIFIFGREDVTNIQKLTTLIYFYLLSRVFDIDAYIIYMVIYKRNQLSALSKVELVHVLFCNTIFLPFLPFVTAFVALLFLNFARPVLYRKIYNFFLDIFVVFDSKKLKSSTVCGLYIAVKCLHVVLLLVFPIIFSYVFKCGYIEYLHQDKGVIQYNLSSLDGNGIRKCDMVEYLSNGLDYNKRNISHRSNTCSAIPGEYVTLSCNVTRSDPTEDIVFIWTKGNNVVNASKKYKITFHWTKDLLTKRYTASSYLTTVLTLSDFNTYKCLTKAITCKMRTVKQMFFRLISDFSSMCTLKSIEQFSVRGEVSLTYFRGTEHVIKAPVGYLLKLKNAFPLNLNASVYDVVFIYGIWSFNSPYKFCYHCVKQYCSLERDEEKVNQFAETNFCVFLLYGRYHLGIRNQSGAIFLHPNSLYIRPMGGYTNTLVQTHLMHNPLYSDFVNTSASDDWSDPKTYLINTSEELLYHYTFLVDRVIWLFLLCVSVFLLYIEIRVYTSLHYIIRKYWELDAFDILHVRETVHDIFFSFCEQSQSDVAFAVDFLLPYFENKYKIRPCHLIKAGAHSLEQYSDEIQRCKKVMILWSENYINDPECKNILSSVILGLHSNGRLKLTDIVILKYKADPVPPPYSFFLNENSVDVPDTSFGSFDSIHDCLLKSFAKDESNIDKLRNNIIVRSLAFISTVIDKYTHNSLKAKCMFYFTLLIVVFMIYSYDLCGYITEQWMWNRRAS